MKTFTKELKKLVQAYRTLAPDKIKNWLTEIDAAQTCCNAENPAEVGTELKHCLEEEGLLEKVPSVACLSLQIPDFLRGSTDNFNKETTAALEILKQESQKKHQALRIMKEMKEYKGLHPAIDLSRESKGSFKVSFCHYVGPHYSYGVSNAKMSPEEHVYCDSYGRITIQKQFQTPYGNGNDITTDIDGENRCVTSFTLKNRTSTDQKIALTFTITSGYAGAYIALDTCEGRQLLFKRASLNHM